MTRILSPRAASLVLVVLLASMPAAVAQQKDAPRLKVTCDRADAIYAAAEKLVAAHRAAHEAKATPEVSQPGVPQGDQTPA